MTDSSPSTSSADPVDESKTLLVAVEPHFVEVAGGFYTPEYSYDYWRQFFHVFDEVITIARIARADAVPEGWVRSDGPRVSFHGVYDYLGFWQFLRHLPRVYLDCRAAMRRRGAVLLRMGNIAQMCWLNLRGGRPYAFEGLGHAGESAARVEHVRRFGLGGLIGAIEHVVCKRVARRADCANYVGQYVRGLYPTSSPQSWVISDVHLPDDAFDQPRPAERFDSSPLRLVTLGRLEAEKGYCFLLEAIAKLTGEGRDLRCAFVGDGRLRDELEQMARGLGIANRIEFHGQVAMGKPVKDILRGCDLFVLPSLTEGLPRALVEAMALGLPCIGSDTGGIPELLPAGCLVRPGSTSSLAETLARVANSPAALARMSTENVETAGQYRAEALRRKRHEFWYCIQRQCEDHAASQGR